MTKQTKFEEDPTKLSREDLEREYKRVLDSRNSIRAHNKSLTQWAERVTNNQTFLATTASIVFQAMAERANCRRHPAVSKIIKALDGCVCAQWVKDEPLPEKLELPTVVDLAAEEENGDAEMLCGARLSQALEPFANDMPIQWSWKERDRKLIDELVAAIHEAMEGMREQVKDRVGFTAKTVTFPAANYLTLSREQLIDVIQHMGWMALDLAQDMSFTRSMLRYDLRDSAYRRIAADLYRLAYVPCPDRDLNFSIKVLGDVEPA